MLDLNLEVISSDSLTSYGKTTRAGMKRLKSLEEESGTSNSSVVNTEEANMVDENNSSNTDSSLLAFDIMMKTEEVKGEIVTRQFFPAVTGGGDGGGGGGGGGDNSRVKKAATARPQWLNLSSGESRGELGILQQKKQQQQPARKSRRGPRSRSSQYRGVTFYRRTGRWESHIWDCGKQVYLGGFDTAYAAARAYDRAAIKFRGVEADINFSVSDYDEDMKQMANLSKEEFVHVLRRQSTGFSREASKYRGVSLQKCGRWDARTRQFSGKMAYEMATLKFNGREAATKVKPGLCEAATMFKPGLYEAEIMFNVGNKGGGQNLDLSLGITSNPSCSKGVENKKEYFQWLDCKGPALRRDISMVGCSSSASNGGGIASFAMPPKRSPIWPVMYPAPLQNYEVTVVEKRIQEIPSSSSSRFPAYRWQVHGNNATATAPASYAVPPFVSDNNNNAASSGFSSSTTTFPQFLAGMPASALLLSKKGVHIPAVGSDYMYRG